MLSLFRNNGKYNGNYYVIGFYEGIIFGSQGRQIREGLKTMGILEDPGGLLGNPLCPNVWG